MDTPVRKARARFYLQSGETRGSIDSDKSSGEPVHHLAEVHKTWLLVHYPAILHHDEVGNAHDVETLSQARPAFGIDFQNNRPPSYLLRGLLHLGGSHPARPAPRCPEVDQDGNPRGRNDLIEGRRVCVDGLRNRREYRPTGAAASLVCQVFRRNSILSSTASTLPNHDNRIARDSPALKCPYGILRPHCGRADPRRTVRGRV